MKNNFIKNLFDILNKKYNYAVLRGYQELPDNFTGHDIDILVDKNQFGKIKKDLASLILHFSYKLLMINENERFVTVVIAKRVGNGLEYLYLDFFFNFSLFGVNLIDAPGVLARKEFNGRIYHVALVDEFLEKYLNTRLLNQSYPDKYKHVLDAVQSEHSAELKKSLAKIFNKQFNNLDTCSQVSGSKLLRTALFSSLSRHPLQQLISSLKFIFFYIRSWLKPNGFSMSLTGPDGSGKTTVLTSVEDSLSNIYREVALYHFRPTVIPRIAELFNKVGLKKEVDTQYDKPHRGGKTGKVSSLIRLTYYLVDYITGYFIVVKPILFRRGVVIFDRYFTDVMSDSRRSRIGLDYKWVFPFRKLVPKMNYSFIIFVEPEEILKRKQELTREQIDTIYGKLNYICKGDRSFVRINNDSAPELATNAIIDHILINQNEKYKQYL